jgi:hypothetical protein
VAPLWTPGAPMARGPRAAKRPSPRNAPTLQVSFGPIQTSGDVRFYAAVKGIADMDSVLIRSAPIY